MKKLLVMTSIMLLAVGICGCGSKKEEEVPEEIPAGEWNYTSEFRTLDLGCDYIMGSALSGETLIMPGVTIVDGTEQKEINFIQYDIKSGKQTKTDVVLTISAEDFFNALCVNSTGNILALITEKGQMKLGEFSISDGTLLSEIDITGIIKSAGANKISQMAIDKEDNLAISDGSSKIWLLDKSGMSTGELSVKGSCRIFTAKDGSFYTAVRDEKGTRVMPFSIETKELGEPVLGPVVLKGKEWETDFVSGKNTDFLFKDAKGLYSFNRETGEAFELFQWELEGINSSTVRMGEYGDNNYFVLSESSEKGGKVSFELALLQQAEKKLSKNDGENSKIDGEVSQTAGKQEIVYGAVYTGTFRPDETEKRIAEFNRTNDKYVIIFKNYGEGFEERASAVEQLNMDIIAGKMPDILDLNLINYEQYAEKGVFEDLYPYMERDGINKEDYLENILRVYEEEGKLYGIIPKFYIETAMGRKSDWGENKGVTVQDILNKLEEKKGSKELRFNQSRGSFMNYMLYTSMEDFIDWENRKCFFDSEEFIKILEEAADYPDIEIDVMNIDIDKYAEENMEYMRQMKAGSFLLDTLLMTSVEDYLWYQEMLGDDLCCIGFPNKEKSGNLIRTGQPPLCISSRSEKKDGAWEYIKMQIGDENQYKDLKFEPESEEDTYFRGTFPIKKAALDKMLEESLNPVFPKDENGKEKPRIYGSTGRTIELKSGGEKEAADAVRDIINSAERLSGSGNSNMIYDIINEESAAFFDGQKTAEEVADIIQSRIQIYVMENS